MRIEDLAPGYPFGAIASFDRDLRYVSAGGKGFARIDVDPPDLLGRTIHEVWPEQTARTLDRHFRRALDGRDSQVRIPYADRTYDCWITPDEGPDGSVRGGLIVTWDVTDLLRERQAGELEFGHLPITRLDVGIKIGAVRKSGHRIVFVNDRFLEMTGLARGDVVGHESLDLLPQAARRAVRRAIARERSVSFTYLASREDDTPFWCRVAVHPVRDEGATVTHYVAVYEDVTEERRDERKRQLAQRMSALGQLAGGVVHDIRNVLMGAGGIVQMVLDEHELEPAVVGELRQVRRILRRGGSVTERLLKFAHARPRDRTEFDLGAVIDEYRAFFDHILRDDIEVRIEGGDRPAWVRADEGDLEQVLLNLTNNAVHAMPHGGTLTFLVAAGKEALDPVPDFEAEAPRDAFVRLTVRDTGVGIPPEDLVRVFDPFFTTKGEKGTGLGLASVFKVVSDMEGEVFLESTEGEGTSAHLVFPAVDSPERGAPRAEVDVESEESAPATANVLLAEDEDAIRKLCRLTLRGEGHTVHEVARGDEALRELERRADEIDLVVTDAVMPGATGAEIAATLHERYPDVPVILMSGYLEDEIGEEDLGDAFSFLAKPFEMGEFKKRVREVLG